GSMISVLLLVRTKPPPPLSTLFPYTTLFRSTASDVIYQELALFKRETGRPVVAVMLDVAASGGYYVALAADTIVAHPTTVTGSRSEEHTSELQSRFELVCRLLLEKKNSIPAQ